MNATKQFKRIFSAVLVLVMLVVALPVDAFAAQNNVLDAVVMFSDLHTSKSNYKESNLKGIMNAFKNAGLPVSSVTSCGDAFSVNEDSGKYTGLTSTLTGYIQSVFSGVPVNYVWSDHDRYAVKADGSTLLDKKSQLVYGAGNDGVYGTSDDGNYYIYSLSMGDLCSYDRYNAGFNYTASSNNRTSKGYTATVEQAIANFQADAAKLDKSKPLLIASHQPLFDNRNDNAWAEDWFNAINKVAEDMDVAFFYGHNHKYDTGSDYYYAKGSTMPVATRTLTNGSSWNYKYEVSSGYKPSIDLKAANKVLNFTHMCAGYLEPTSTGSYSSSTTRVGTAIAVTIYEDSIQYTTYNSKGVYTGNFAVNVNVKRDHAKAEVVEPETTVPETTVPETTVPETTEPTVPETTEPVVPEVPETPDVPTTENEWVALPAGNTYVLDTDGIDSGAKYLVVAKSYAKALTAASSKNNASDVVIEGNNATADAGYGWTIIKSGSAYTIEKNGTYLNRSSSSLAAGSASNTWTVSNSGNGQYTITQSGSSSWWGSSSKYYVRWSNSNGYFQASSSNTDPVRLYKYAGSGSSIGANYIRLAGNTQQEYTIADAATLNTVLGKLKIQTSADGVNADTATIAVTADMVSWNTAFNGKTAGTYIGTVTCEDKVLGTVTVNITGAHEFETVTVAATCEKNGSITTTCTICGEQTVEVIPAIGHNYACVETAATCGQDGNKVYTCANCNDSYTEVIPATGKHTYETMVVDADCTTNGSKTHTCTVCAHTYTEQIPATGHSYTTQVTAPTCTEVGFTTYTCACGDSYIADEVAALGHKYAEKTTAATCTQDGITVYTCACGDTYSQVIPATGHTYTAKVTAPTCTEVGYTTYTCVCGDSYIADEVAAPGHSYTAKVTAPTCTEVGYTTYTCVCGDSYTADEVAALGHKYDAVVTEPTCEKAGYTTYTCSVCGDSYTGNQVAALGHKYDAVVTDPTCTEAGYTTYTCSVCGDSYTGNQVAALGHNYTAVESNGYMVYTCDSCGHSYSEKIENLTYTKVSSISSGNAYVITFKSGSSYYAMSHANNKLSATKVTVSNNVITSEISEDLVWNYSGSKLSYENNGTTYYLYAQSSGWWGWGTPTLTLSNSNSTSITFSNSKVKMSYYYLRYSNGTISLNRSATTTYFFVEG